MFSSPPMRGSVGGGLTWVETGPTHHTEMPTFGSGRGLSGSVDAESNVRIAHRAIRRLEHRNDLLVSGRTGLP